MLIKLNIQRFATSQVSIDLTTLSGWGNVADGQHSIQVVAKADNYRDSEKSTAVNFTKGSTTVTLSAGKYMFNETLNITKGIDMEQNITGKMNTLTANNTYGAQKVFAIMYVAYLDDPTNPITTMQILDEAAENFVIYTAGGWQYNDGQTGENLTVTDTTKLRTIVIETDQEVSQEFKDWWDENTTKQTAVTHTLTWDDGQYTIVVDSNTVKDANDGAGSYTFSSGAEISINNLTTISAFTINGKSYSSQTVTYLINQDITITSTARPVMSNFVILIYTEDNNGSGGNIQ